MKTPKTVPQAGIINRPPDHAYVTAYTLNATDPAGARDALERLRTLLASELRSNLDETSPASPKEQPSAETGELGFVDGYDRYHLTVTFGLGSGAFDKLGASPDERPQDLVAIPWAQLSDSPTQTAENGDVVLQVCSDSVYVAEHVLRRVDEELGNVLVAVWTLAGHQRHTSRAGRPSREEGRALIGFKDGTSNLNPRREPADARLVFVDPARVGDYPPARPVEQPGQPSPYGGPAAPQFPPDLRTPPAREPAWTKDGTYMVVRGSLFDARAWDARPLGDQERTVGRWKVSGQPLDHPDDPHAPMAEPDLLGDATGAITPLNAHVRKTNPRGPGDQDRRIFRRGYPLLGATGAGGLQRGLLFVCFGRTITTQFEFITRAWTTNPNFPQPGTGPDPLRAIDQVLCGGYFFVPPATNGRQPWSFALPPAA